MPTPGLPPDFDQQVALFRHDFLRESWLLYGLATTAILLRFLSRYRRLGLRGAELDDLLMVIALAAFTTFTYGENHILARGAYVSYVPDLKYLKYLKPDQIKARVHNTKWNYTDKQLQVLTLWIAKFCLCIIYLRITKGVSARRWLYGIVGYVVAAFVANELALFLTCIPISKRWEPGTDRNCFFFDDYQIGEAILSCTSTTLILVSGLPVLWRAKLPPRQKYIMVILFGLGIFDLVADILVHVETTKSNPYGFRFKAWNMRICAIALMTCNLPFAWALLTDMFPSLKVWAMKDFSASAQGTNKSSGFWRSSREGKWWSLNCFGKGEKMKKGKMMTLSTIDDEEAARPATSRKLETELSRIDSR